MSKVLGIIAEYNPFHNGHLHHLQTSQSLINADYTVAIISGNFTQRGSTSIVDKWSKAKMALNNGIDLVIELPVLYSISSAENFADGAIKILNSLGIIDYLSFGAETTDINSLRTIADILRTEPPEYKNILSTELDKGLSFPKAREKALLEYTSNLDNKLYFKNILSSPNNILGIEYLKALKKYNSTIKPLCIKRINAEYNSKNFSNNFGSATAIRELIKNNDYNTIKKLTPECTYSILADNLQNGSIVPEINIFEKEIIYNLRKMSIERIANIPDVSEGLEFSIKKAANSCNNIKEFLDIIKSKRYTLTRLQRILLYVLLDILWLINGCYAATANVMHNYGLPVLYSPNIYTIYSACNPPSNKLSIDFAPVGIRRSYSLYANTSYAVANVSVGWSFSAAANIFVNFASLIPFTYNNSSVSFNTFL